MLVTGATGLIGSHLLDALGSGGDVVAASRLPRPDVAGTRWHVCDLERAGAATDLVRAVEPEIVIHLAGEVRGDRTLAAVGPTLRTNLVATIELLEAATVIGCRRIVLSGSLLEEPIGAASGLVRPSPYGASRWAASAYGRMFHALFDAPVTILRPSYAYGPGQDAMKLIPYVTHALLGGERPRLGSGDRLVDWVYAGDVAQAYVAAATVAGVEGRTLDVGGPFRATVREVVGAIVEQLGLRGAEPLFGDVAARPLEQEVEPDLEATAAALGWRATTDLAAGLRHTIGWIRARHVRVAGSPRPRAPA